MLIDREVSRAKPKPAAYRLTDGRGLYLMVTPSGGKLWRYKYRFEGKEKLMSLGQYPEVSLKAVRERHNAARAFLSSGIDPMALRAAERSTEGNQRSFQAVGQMWLEHWSAGNGSKHVQTTARRLLTNVYPLIGARPIDEVIAPELVVMVKAIEERGASDLAKRALQTCGQIFRYGIAHGYCKRNPAVDIKPADVLRPYQSENMARVSSRELPALLKAIELYSGSVVTRLGMKLMALTFLRTSELIGGRWDEIDWDGRRWDIPKERMKMGSPHIVPLSDQALDVLDSLRICTGKGDLIFPGLGHSDKPMSNNTILFAIYRMGYKGLMTGHGFRGLASTILHEQGWPHDHIEIQLAHSKRDAVSAAYNHALYLEPRRAMMKAWGEYLEKASRKG